jgi:thiamine-phosphate pyrophosphorylase
VKGYYFITDSTLSASGIASDVKKAVAAGVGLIQYRSKAPQTRFLYEEACLMKELVRGSASLLIINDRIDIALAVHADGVHIGREDLPCDAARRLLGRSRVIGVTVHTAEEALEAQAAGADYLAVSPVFATSTKPDAGHPCGVEALREVRNSCRLPVVAIGGIDLTNADQVVRAGADMVCAVSAVVTKRDVAVEIRKFQEVFGI